MCQANGILAGRNLGSQVRFGYSHVDGSMDVEGILLNAGHVLFLTVAADLVWALSVSNK